MDYTSNKDSQNNEKGNRTLSGMKFRDLVHVMDQPQPQDKVMEDNLFFSATEPQVDEMKFDDSMNSSIAVFANGVKVRVKAFLSKFFFLRFIGEMISYVYYRMRVMLILMSVFGEVLGSQLEVLKKLVIKRMFWGRGNLFNFSVKFFVLFLVLLVFLSGVYRGGKIEATYQIAAAQSDTIQASNQADVFKQNSSTKTIVNEDAQRYHAEEYTVKGGDTISAIATEHNLKASTVLWANGLTENDVIKPGMKLLLPNGDGVLVKVKDGDTVESLAEKYGSIGQLIVEINLLEPPTYALTVGEQLFLPNGEMPAPPKPKPQPQQQAPTYSGIVSGPANTGTSRPITGGGRWLSWPVAGGGGLTQCYTGWHNGIDIADKSWPTVVAAAPGTVTFSGCQSGNCPAQGVGYGGWGLAWTVIVDHGNGFSTVYAHLNKLYVSSGQYVTTGAPVGQMGATGLAYGVHLHFMLVYSGTWSSVNPAPYMTTNLCGY